MARVADRPKYVTCYVILNITELFNTFSCKISNLRPDTSLVCKGILLNSLVYVFNERNVFNVANKNKFYVFDPFVSERDKK